MKRLLVAITVLLLGAGPSYAQKTKLQINTEITTNFPDNSSGQITPLGLRNVTSDIANSIMPTAPVVTGNLACFNGTTGLLQDCGSAPTTVPLTVGITPVNSGVSGQVLYANGSLLGQYSNTQLTSLINLATTSLSGALPAWPNNTTTFFRGDGSYATLNFAALGGAATLAQLPAGTSDTVLGYWGSTVVSAASIPNCSNALAYSTSTHLWSCNTLAGTGTVSSAQISASGGLQVATTSGANPCISTCNLTVSQKLDSQVLAATPGTPTGTSSATGVMMGLGTVCKLTPSYSSRVRLEFKGSLSNSTLSALVNVSARFGTGVAPTNGVASAGSAVGAQVVGLVNVANYSTPAAFGSIITGLTPGTAYWFDVQMSVSSGAGIINNPTCDAFEVM